MLGAKMKDWDQESDGDWECSKFYSCPIIEDSFREIIPSFFSEIAIQTVDEWVWKTGSISFQWNLISLKWKKTHMDH